MAVPPGTGSEHQQPPVLTSCSRSGNSEKGNNSSKAEQSLFHRSCQQSWEATDVFCYLQDFLLDHVNPLLHSSYAAKHPKMREKWVFLSAESEKNRNGNDGRGSEQSSCWQSSQSLLTPTMSLPISNTNLCNSFNIVDFITRAIQDRTKKITAEPNIF